MYTKKPSKMPLEALEGGWGQNPYFGESLIRGQ